MLPCCLVATNQNYRLDPKNERRTTTVSHDFLIATRDATTTGVAIPMGTPTRDVPKSMIGVVVPRDNLNSVSVTVDVTIVGVEETVTTVNDLLEIQMPEEQTLTSPGAEVQPNNPRLSTEMGEVAVVTEVMDRSKAGRTRKIRGDGGRPNNLRLSLKKDRTDRNRAGPTRKIRGVVVLPNNRRWNFNKMPTMVVHGPVALRNNHNLNNHEASTNPWRMPPAGLGVKNQYRKQQWKNKADRLICN